MTPTFLVLALLGCVPPDEPLDKPIGQFIEDAYTVQGFEASSAVGNVPLFPVVRAVNQYGASIPSEPQGILVDGASQTVSFDAVGYGRVRIDAAGVSTIDDGISVVEAVAYDSSWGGLGISRAFESVAPGATGAVGISTGTIVSIGRELWYVGPEAEPHRVLNAEGVIQGMEAGHINVDGVLDVVAWTEDQVYLMRGRLNGGLAYGAALRADRYTVGGASVGELTGDNLPDLVIAWAATDGTSKIDTWHGNGLFGFKAAEPRNLPAIPISVSIGDNTGEGTNQITVLAEDGTWSRYIAGSPDRYMPIGPNTPSEVSIPLGSTVEANGDINGDEGSEMWFLGPLNPDQVRRIVVVDIVGNKIEFLPLTPMAAWVDRADLDGNGLIDHIELSNTASLRSLSFDETSANSYTSREVATLPAYGPMVAEDIVDGDGVPDLFVADDDIWWWWRGTNNPLSSDVFWQIGEQAMVQAGSTIGAIRIEERDGNPNTLEIIGFEDVGGGTWLTAWSWNKNTQAASVLSSIELSPVGVDPVDVELCGNRIWALLEGTLYRVNATDLGNLAATITTPTSATAIDCGIGPSGGELALLDNGTVEVVDAAVSVVATFATPGAQDVALGDVGNGPEVMTCTTPGCSVVYWPDGASGGTFAIGTDTQIRLEGGGTALTTSGRGLLSVYDIDADGSTDLVGTSGDGLITVLRSTGVEAGVPEFFHTRATSTSAAAVGDADGDGDPDLWVRDATDRLLYSVAPIDFSAPETTTTTTP